MKTFTQNLKKSPALIALILSSIALIFSLFLEHFINLLPCYLCNLQRYGYIAILILSILGIIYKRRRIYNFLTCIAFCLIIATGVWHKGIEEYWWEASSECASINYNIGSLKEELDNINTEKPIAACDLSSPEFMGITLVEWSLLYAFISLLFMIYILHKNYGNKNEL